jgi:uncharacterized membrane protein
MKQLLKYFLRGLVLVAPIGITVYICYVAFVAIDRLLPTPVPGAGFLIMVAAVTLFGFLASNLLARSVLSIVERLLERLPFVRLLYSSTRDLLNAFVGEKRRFDKPVLISLEPGGNVKAFGFLTQESLELIGMPGHAAVYLPQSYNFAGQVLVVPRAQITMLSAPSSDVMAFIVSGGVSGIAARRDVVAAPALPSSSGAAGD